MEIALSDCTDSSPFSFTFPAKFQVIVFCLASEDLQAPEEVAELGGFYIPETMDTEQRKYWVRTSGLMQLGYLCGVLSPHRVTVYSERASDAQAPFSWELQRLRPPPAQYVTPQCPEPRSDLFPAALLTQLSFDVSLKCLRTLIKESGSDVLKQDTLLKRLRNWSDTSIVSRRKQAAEIAFPSEEEVTQKAFSVLSALGVFEPQGQMVRVTLPCEGEEEAGSWLRARMPALSP